MRFLSHPVIRTKMGEKWLFSMFEEKEIIYDMITQGWFVSPRFYGSLVGAAEPVDRFGRRSLSIR
jgi:hypothetical protein